ncbi:hypothetical protein GCM10017668_08340 [Streptomyces tuirus]|uniref:Uncharacterized protein n=1 Tax=Streptomyces tuirus TaxID=68278 RepID=A0A7G1N8C3_9ACTN|nr:hypothetical protein GCM10017668_08340 [Streptomyces tuirus]
MALIGTRLTRGSEDRELVDSEGRCRPGVLRPERRTAARHQAREIDRPGLVAPDPPGAGSPGATERVTLRLLHPRPPRYLERGRVRLTEREER